MTGEVAPTPVERYSRLAAACGVQTLLVKRDDLIGFGGGGSKARKVEGWKRESEALQATCWVVTGGPHSNQIRLASIAARSLGLRCVAVAFGEPPVHSGNLAIATLVEAELHLHAGLVDVFGQQRILRRLVAELRGQGETVWSVPGAHPRDLEFYARGAAEFPLTGEAEVYVAAGTGATAAGLALGFQASPHCRVRIHAVSVHLPAKALEQAFERLWQGAGRRPAESVQVLFDDRWIGPGYDCVTQESMGAVKQAAACGLLLEPIYTGRAFAAALAGRLDRPRGAATVLWHTGGGPMSSDHLAYHSLNE